MRLSQCRLDMWGAREGLPGYAITALAQTPDGYLWVGTGVGLYRFDGSTFTRFDHTNMPSFPDSVEALCVARDGTLWVGTDWGGFGRFVDGRFERTPFPENGWNSTRLLHQAPDGAIWAFYRHVGGSLLIRSDRSGIMSTPLLGPAEVTGMLDRPDGSMIAVVQYGAMLQVSKAGVVSKYDGQIPATLNNFSCGLLGSDGTLWLGTDNSGLFKVAGGRISLITEANGLACNTVNNLLEDRYHRIIVGTASGLNCISPEGIERISRGDGLGGHGVSGTMIDCEGSLWATTGPVLNRFAETPLATVLTTTAKQAYYQKIVCAPDGNTYIATADAVYCQPADPGRLPRPIYNLGAEGVAVTSNGDLVTWRHESGADAAFVDRIRRCHAGKWTDLGNVSFPIFALLSEKGGLTFLGYNGDTQQPNGPRSSATAQLKGPMSYALRRNPDGTAWLGCDAGLVLIQDGVSTVADIGLPRGAHVLSIDNTDPKCLWLGTDHGIARVVNGHATMYDHTIGLPLDECLQLLRDNRGGLWVGCAIGIYHVAIADLNAHDAGREPWIPSRLYSASDGVKSGMRLEMPARGTDGKLWFISSEGITCIDPSDLRTNPVAPPIQIEAADANGQTLQAGAPAVVPPGRGDFSIHFAGLSFDAPEKVLFKYRLLGYDSRWTGPTTQRSASFTNLPPGHYRFEVVAANKDGIWSSSPVSVAFTLEPHFYETLWFRIVCVAGFLLLGLAILALRTAQMRARARYLEQLVAERTAELAEAHERVQWQNSELQDMQGELEAQNTELQDVQVELEVQNEQLHDVQQELEAQNRDLIQTQETLAAANLRLQSLATSDGLTDLLNHRGFQDRLSEEYSRLYREGGPLSLILLDVDNFKNYNDTYGHPAGDDVLRTVAAILRETVRATDIVARYGGEEFVIVVPKTNAADVVELAERVRRAIAGHPWKLREVTASFGAATIDMSAEMVYPSSGDLIGAADEQLYESKRAGRDRVSHRSMRPVILPAA